MFKREDVPKKKNINGVLIDLTDDEIDKFVEKLNTPEVDNRAYDEKRRDAYPTVADFMEAYTEKEIGSSSTKWDAYVTAYNKVRSDNPKP